MLHCCAAKCHSKQLTMRVQFINDGIYEQGHNFINRISPWGRELEVFQLWGFNPILFDLGFTEWSLTSTAIKIHGRTQSSYRTAHMVLFFHTSIPHLWFNSFIKSTVRNSAIVIWYGDCHDVVPLRGMSKIQSNRVYCCDIPWEFKKGKGGQSIFALLESS